MTVRDRDLQAVYKALARAKYTIQFAGMPTRSADLRLVSEAWGAMIRLQERLEAMEARLAQSVPVSQPRLVAEGWDDADHVAGGVGGGGDRGVLPRGPYPRGDGVGSDDA